jgi:tetratricopeptide (TPR) repeat protein
MSAFMTSAYYADMVDQRLDDIVAHRQHVDLAADTRDRVRIPLRMSPSAASFVLFGDTTRYDNLADQMSGESISAEGRARMSALGLEQLCLDVMSRYANDVARSLTPKALGNDEVLLQVLSLGVTASNVQKRLFGLQQHAPIVQMVAGGPIRAGEAVSMQDPAGFLVNLGIAFAHAEFHDLAIERFDDALSQTADPEITKAALHNKGRALLCLSQPREAIQLFKRVLDMDPDHAMTKAALAEAICMADGTQ